jgi:hypothetical protein
MKPPTGDEEMKSSTRNMLLSVAVVPVALFGALPAHADTGRETGRDATDGPTAALLRGVTAKTPVASVTDPVVGSATRVVDGLVSTAQGAGSVNTSRTGAQDVVARLGSTVSELLGLKMDGVSARCASTASGAFKVVTTVTNGTAADKAIPANPLVNTKLPLLDGALVILNEQTRDAKGALTVTGARIIEKSGRTTDLAVAKCVSAERVAGAARKKSGDPLASLLNSLLGAPLPEPLGSAAAPVVDQVRGLTGGLGGMTEPLQGVTGALPVGDLASGLPAAPLRAPGLPDALPMNLDDTLSGLLGGVPGLPGQLPSGLDSVLPKLPVG